MLRSSFILVCALALTACDSETEGNGGGETGGGEMDAGGDQDGSADGDGTADGDSTDDGTDDGEDSGDEGGGSEVPASCDEIELAPLDDDPDQGYIDVTDFCLELINEYRAMEGLSLIHI